MVGGDARGARARLSLFFIFSNSLSPAVPSLLVGRRADGPERPRQDRRAGGGQGRARRDGRQDGRRRARPLGVGGFQGFAVCV